MVVSSVTRDTVDGDGGPVVPGGDAVGCADVAVGVVSGVLLFTPAQAAGLLQVRESWLRRRAGERRVPCSFVGKHLRFSRADLESIVADGRPASSVGRRRRSRVPASRSVSSRGRVHPLGGDDYIPACARGGYGASMSPCPQWSGDVRWLKGLVLMAWVEKHGLGFRVRYRLPDGTLASETGFATHKAAADRASDVESEQRIGTFVDPRLAQTGVGEWVRRVVRRA